MRMFKAAALASLVLPMCACTTVMDTVKGPQLAPMGYPTALVPINQQIQPAAAGQAAQPASANSLWRAGARAFFIDQRAAKVGDILTVQIDIDDSATTSNSSSSSRSSGSNLGVPHFFGFENSIGKVFPESYDPSNMIGTESEHSNSGSGAITRKEQITLTIAAVVTQMLPNGNMVIQGTQEVRTNNEVRQLTVSGIVRPEDITSQNTIRHTQIAEARINYGGRGDQSRVQKTPGGQALVERFSPF